LEVDTAGRLDLVFIPRRERLGVGAHTLGHVHAGGVDVYVVEEAVLHERVVALLVGGGQAEVFVEVERRYLREVEAVLGVVAHEALVRGLGGASRGEAQHAVGFHQDLVADDTGGHFGHLLGVSYDDDFHDCGRLLGSGQRA
jgi:hypothetical protein